MKTRSRGKRAKIWELVGHVGVDSGQLLVCDPCYIDSQWLKDKEPMGHPAVVLTAKGKAEFPGLLAWRSQWPFPWGSYEDVCPEMGVSINDARAAGLIQDVDMDPSREFSYRGACDVSHGSGSRFGELEFRAGHTGAGVAFGSGYGDGVYPVMGRRNGDGRIVEVRVLMEITAAQKKLFGL